MEIHIYVSWYQHHRLGYDFDISPTTYDIWVCLIIGCLPKKSGDVCWETDEPGKSWLFPWLVRSLCSFDNLNKS